MSERGRNWSFRSMRVRLVLVVLVACVLAAVLPVVASAAVHTYDLSPTATTSSSNVEPEAADGNLTALWFSRSAVAVFRGVSATEEGAGAFELPEGFKPIAGGSPEGDATVSETLAGKLGSIRRAPLPPGSPAWEDIGDMTLSEVQAAAQANEPGFKTIFKLLTDNRFNKP